VSSTRRQVLSAGIGLLAMSSAQADLTCKALPAGADINFVGNSFPAIQHLARIAEACTRPGLKVAFKLTPQARVETELAFASQSPSPFDAAVVSMGTFSTLYSRRQLAPMSDLVAKFGARFALEERMLVRVDGEVMAIAFMQNTQNLYLRQDLFDRHRLAVPVTYADMLSAARTLEAREPSISFPVAQGFGKGFDSATEFTNILASLGGRYFEPNSARPTFQTEAGVQAVEVMRSVLPHMTPNALASNSDDVMNQLQQGSAAMGVLWASRASRMDDAAVSKVVGKMAFAAAPSALPGGRSAAHLWWDGVVMPKNLSSQLTRDPARREAAFLVMMDMLSEASVREGNDLTIWVRSAFRPGRFGTGVAVAQKAGAPVWPGEPFFSLAHAEVGKVLPDALKGERSPRDALAAAAQAYISVATDKGFLGSTRKAA
jgi:multiple sugar transport system substrate-binding protein